MLAKVDQNIKQQNVVMELPEILKDACKFFAELINSVYQLFFSKALCLQIGAMGRASSMFV